MSRQPVLGCRLTVARSFCVWGCMYFHVRSNSDYEPHQQDLQRSRKATMQAREQAESMDLREAAMERRRAIKAWRLAEYAGNEELKAKAVARARTFRRTMEGRING